MSEKDLTAKPERQNDEPVPARSVDNALNADLALALSTGPQLNAVGITAFKLYLILLVAFMGSLSFGFDTTGHLNGGCSQFTDYFGIGGGDSGGGQGIITAMLYSIFSFGCIAGSFLAGPVADRWGRRGGMFTASIIILAGVSIVTAAQSRIYLFFGRFAIGLNINRHLIASHRPAYVSELAPPQWRGRLAGLYNLSGFIGSVICSGVVIATGRIDSSLSWRLPFAIQFIPTIILAVGVWFIPESPRWLMSVGRKDEARRILAKYHGNGDENAPLVLLECRELETSITIDVSNKGWRDLFNYSELFNSRGARYRTFITSWMAICCLWSGIGIFYYITVVFDLAGVKTQDGRLTFSSIAVAMGAFGALCGSLVVDRVGRRTLWLWGTAFSAVILAAAAGKLSSLFPGAVLLWSLGFTAKAESKAAIAFIRENSFVGVGELTMVLLGLYPAECLNFSARSKGLALFALIGSLAALVNNFGGAIAFQKIGWKYMLVFAVWDVVETIVIWFCAVETKGRTLEELDEIFEDHHPVNASLTKRRGLA
ncbi:general substrate transporter [Mycena leptocephala]|nr:general substrate transporter [Mycena leptocephala]